MVPKMQFTTYKGHPCTVLWVGNDYALIKIGERRISIQQRQIKRYLREDTQNS